MSRYSLLNPRVIKRGLLLIGALMFCGYYFLWGVFYFLVTAPDQALAVTAFMGSSVARAIAVSGFFSGFFLSMFGMASESMGFVTFFKQRDWMNVIKWLIFSVLLASIWLAPLVAFEHNAAIRQECSPVMLGTFIVLFLIVATAALYRPSIVSRELQHAE